MNKTVKLETLKPGTLFRCPWNNKVFELEGVTPSAAWVKVEELVEKEMKDRKTGLTKLVKFKKKYNEPWSRSTKVEVVEESNIIQNNQKESENENQNSLRIM
jgi:hypothetical protein